MPQVPPASFKNCKSNEKDPLHVLKLAMAERNGFKRKCRMYSRRQTHADDLLVQSGSGNARLAMLNRRCTRSLAATGGKAPIFLAIGGSGG